MQRGEGIRRNLRPCSRNLLQQRRFAGIRITNQSCVCNRSQFEQEISLLPFFSLRVLAWRAVARAFEMHIALPSSSTATKNKFLTVTREIGKGLFDMRLMSHL